MKLVLNGKEFKVWWRHTPNGPNSVLQLFGGAVRKKLLKERGTTCFIELLGVDGASVTFTGKARCNPEDQFVKEEGRGLSLERAASLLAPWLNLPTEDCLEEVFRQYDARKPNKPVSSD